MIDQRRHSRTPTQVKVYCHTHSGWRPGQIDDFSSSGIRLRLEQSISRWERVQVMRPLGANLTAKICWMKPVNDVVRWASYFVYGCQIEGEA